MQDVSEGRSDGSREMKETQVALRYVMAKGCIPIPGVYNAEQAAEVVETLDWSLHPRRRTRSNFEALSEHALRLHSRRKELPWLKRL